MSNDFETIIDKTGWGLCHYFIVGLCGMCTVAEAGASLIVLIVAPLLACDLKLNRSQATALHVTSSFGMAVGAFLFGTIADANGRKGSIPVTMVIVFCASIALSFAQTNFLINLSIFMVGVGLAGNNALLRIYLIEFLPTRRRGSCLALLDLLWVTGYLSALGISWTLVPSAVRLQGQKFRPNSWRVLSGLGGTPSLVMACVASLLPPSPRHMLHRRREDEALSVLQQMYAINTSRHVDTYPPAVLENCIRPDDEDEGNTNGIVKTVRKYCVKTAKRIRELHKAPFKCTAILGILICVLQFPGLVWLALWNTRVLEEMERERDAKTMERNSTCIVDTEDMALGFLHTCEEANANRFAFLLLLSLSYLLGEAILSAGIDIVGRKNFLVFSCAVGAAASISLVFAVHSATLVVVSVIFLATYAIARTTTTILLLENFPTGLRGTIIGFTRILPYLAVSFVNFNLSVSCVPTIIAVSVLMIGTAITVLPIPDLTRSPMHE